MDPETTTHSRWTMDDGGGWWCCSGGGVVAKVRENGLPRDDLRRNQAPLFIGWNSGLATGRDQWPRPRGHIFSFFINEFCPDIAHHVPWGFPMARGQRLSCTCKILRILALTTAPCPFVTPRGGLIWLFVFFCRLWGMTTAHARWARPVVSFWSSCFGLGVLLRDRACHVIPPSCTLCWFWLLICFFWSFKLLNPCFIKRNKETSFFQH